jgi:acyl carrier protein
MDMTVADIKKLVEEAVTENLSLAAGKYDEESTLMDLGADSLDAVEIVMHLEETLVIIVPDEDADHCEKPADLVRLLIRTLGLDEG